MRTFAVALTAVLLVACGGGSTEETPLTLPERTSQATPADDPVVSPQDDIVVATIPPLGTGGSEMGAGPATIGPDCAAYLAPARALLATARSGTDLTAAQASALQDRINGALDVCSPDEYVAFQTEMFPSGEATPSSAP